MLRLVTLITVLSATMAMAGSDVEIKTDGAEFLSEVPLVSPPSTTPKSDPVKKTTAKPPKKLKTVRKKVTPTVLPVPIASPSPTPSPSPSPTPISTPVVTPIVPPPFPPAPTSEALPKAEARATRVPAASLKTQLPREEEKENRFNFSLGALAGPDYSFPALQFEVALGSSFSLGLTAVAYNNFSSMSAYGGMLGIAYFFGQPLHGPHFRTGLGMYALTGTDGVTTEKAAPLIWVTTANWRFFLSRAWNLGLGAGVQYLFGNTSNEILLSGAVPLFTVDLGYSF